VGLKLIVLTTSIPGERAGEEFGEGFGYDAILKKVRGAGAPVADVKALMTAAREKGGSYCWKRIRCILYFCGAVADCAGGAGFAGAS